MAAFSSRIDVPVSARYACSSESVLGLLLQLLRRALRDDPAVVDDPDALRDAVRFVHVVRGEEHGDALGLIEVLDVRPQLVAALRVEAERRLVEEQDLRRVQKAAGNLEPPLHPAGELLDRRVPAVPQLEQLEERLGPLVSGRARGTW